VTSSPLRRLARTALLPTIVVAAAGCSVAPSESTYPGANILLVTIDTLRADRLGAYGYEAARTPTLDSLAGEGILFEQAFSPTPLTLPAHSTLMTSAYPAVHGVRDNGSQELSPELVTLAERLADEGYDTGAFVAAYVLHSRWGLARGFSTYDEEFGRSSVEPTPLQAERTGDRVVDAAVPWLTRARQAPFFAWVHLYDPHAPYDPPEPQSSQNADAYDGEVAFADALVGRLLGALESAGVADNTVVIVTADHGEGLRDHGEPGHGLFLYDTTIRVPLLVRLPDRSHAGQRVPQQVRLMDVAPTALGLVGVAPPDTFDGGSLMELVSDPGAPGRLVYAETYYPRLHFGWSEMHAVRSDGRKYIHAPSPELYAVSEDGGESVDIFDPRDGSMGDYVALIEEHRGEPPDLAAASLTQEAAQQLGALGYLAGGAADSTGPRADPKDKVGVFVMLNDAQALLLRGDPGAAVRLLESVVEQEPQLVDGLVGLGNARMRTADYAGAADAYRDALAANPDYTVARGNLATAYRRLGELDAARRELDDLLRIDPTSTAARFSLGEVALQQRDPGAALEHFRAGAMSAPAAPEFAFGTGVALLQLDDPEAARRSLEAALAVAPEYPEAHYYLALIAELDGDAEVAIGYYQTEVGAHPLAHRAWHNLAMLYNDQGRHTEASEAFTRAVTAQPRFAVSYLYLARSLLALNDPARLPEAAAAARRGLDLEPPVEIRPLGHRLLAEYYRRSGQADLAERELQRAAAAERAARGGIGRS